MYMQRCIALAMLGANYAAPNPMVGAVLVYNDCIIGEGYHEKYGEAHAEVNCINSVLSTDINLIEKSILFVSLEPCAHFGKTPPCVNLIIEKKIPHVVIGCNDSFESVNGKGIQMLKDAGIKVEVSVLESKCRALNKRFFIFNEVKRPYIFLKWAETNDGFISDENGGPINISNNRTNKWVHKWRSEAAAILVGTNTAIKDNPTLTVRNWTGKNPTRFIIDLKNDVPPSSNIFNKEANTIILNYKKREVINNIEYYKISEGDDVIIEVLKYAFKKNIQSIIIEGGTKTINLFLNQNLWDEATVIKNTNLNIGKGIFAPQLKNEILINSTTILTDRINFYKNNQNEFL
jgi:diaminohydroxyphosphoribosylaminopyrimidine deaminase / 5-amino-6-(5-phosphoribosylamino)uracil reductase